jgi:hypothetical protein
MSLPIEKKKPSVNLWDYTIFLYGESKVGKSTLISQIPNVLFLNTGGGLDALECFEQPITSWEQFLDAGKEIVGNGHKFDVIAIDTVDRLAKLCINHIMTKLEIVHPQDLGYGKGYDLVKDELLRPLMKLALSKYGLILVSHAKDVEITTRTSKITKFLPSIQDYMYNIIAPICGITLFYDTVETENGERRVLRTRLSEKWIAGDRTGKLEAYGDIIMAPPPANNWDKVQKIFAGQIKKGE